MMKKNIFKKAVAALVVSFLSTASYADDCVEETVKVKLPESQTYSNYWRLSPNGKYLLSTVDRGGIEILKINYDVENGYSLKAIDTPLNDESFPVEPEWKYISSPYHDDGTMKYFTLKDLEEKERDAEAVYSSEFNEFYHSIGGDENGFSVTRWSFLGTRDYVTRDNQIVEESDTYVICSNLFNLPPELEPYRKLLNTTFLYVQAQLSILNDEDKNVDFYFELSDEDIAKITLEYEEKFGKPLDSFDEEEYEDYEIALDEFETINTYNIIAEELLENGSLDIQDYDLFMKFLGDWSKFEDVEGFTEFILEQPILSQNGDMIAGLYDGSMKVYNINEDKTCSEVKDVGFRTSKVTFSYNDSDFTDRLVTFTYESDGDENSSYYDSLVVLNLDDDKLYEIEKLAASSYPNMTKDGRLFYSNGDDLVITDLYSQSQGAIDSNAKQCVTKSELEAIYQDPSKI